jgi:serine/threonine protein kinase
VYDYGRTPEGVFYYAMEHLDGGDLDDLVAYAGALPAGRVVFILEQVCGALQEAHAAGLVHRDVKPANMGSKPTRFEAGTQVAVDAHGRAGPVQPRPAA